MGGMLEWLPSLTLKPCHGMEQGQASPASSEVGPIILISLQMRKLRHRAEAQGFERIDWR